MPEIDGPEELAKNRQRAERLAALPPLPEPAGGASPIDRIRIRLARSQRLAALARAYFAALLFEPAAAAFRDLEEAREELAEELDSVGDAVSAAFERDNRALDGWTFGQPALARPLLEAPERRVHGLPLYRYPGEFLRWALLGDRIKGQEWFGAFERAELEARRRKERTAEAKGWEDGRQEPAEEDLEAARGRFWLGHLDQAKTLADSAVRRITGWPTSFTLGRYGRTEALAWARGLAALLEGRDRPRKLPGAEKRLLQALRAAPGSPETCDRTGIVILIVIGRAWRDDPRTGAFQRAFPGLESLTARDPDGQLSRAPMP